MGKDTRVPDMVRGLSFANKLLLGLVEEIRKLGGSEEILHALTTPKYSEQIPQLAKMIVSLAWRNPEKLTQVRALARILSEKNGRGDNTFVENDEIFFWQLALRDLGIPFLRLFADDDENAYGAEYAYPLPKEVAEQLDGKPAVPALHIEWQGLDYIVVCMSYDQRFQGPDLNETIDSRKIDSVCISLARNFDLLN